MKWEYNDGGRKKAGYKGDAGDCAVRAIAIATGKPYQEVYDRINEISKSERTGKRKKGKSSARTGVFRDTFKKYLEAELGWKWTPTMFIGQGCRIHLREGELPKGTLIVNLSKHYAAVINGIVQDTHDPSRGGERCVYGYWNKE
jgi:hypothetical protein